MKTADRDAKSRGQAADDAGAKLWTLSAFMFGVFLTWSYLAPADATSVFDGATQAQSLFCLTLCVCVAVAVALTGHGLRFSLWQWSVALLCLGWLIVGTVHAGEENNPRVAWYGFWHVIALAGFFLSGCALLRKPRSQAMALTIVLAGFCSLAAHGMYQVAIGFPASRAQYEASPERVFESSGLDAPEASPLRKRFEDRLYSPEPYSTFSLTNSLAVVQSGGLIIAISLLAIVFKPAEGEMSRTSVVIPVAAVIAMVLILVIWFLTRSRSAYLSVLLALMLWGFQSLLVSRGRKRKLPVKAIAVAVGVSVVMIGGGVFWLMRNDILVISEAAKSFAFRLQYWQATAAMIRDHWGWGVGLGNFQSYYPAYMLPTASETIADPHNWVLDIAATLSLPIAIVVSVWLGRRLLVTIQAGMVPATTDAKDPFDEKIAKSILCGAAVGMVGCSILIWLLVGIDLWGVWLAALIGIPLAVVLSPAMERLIRDAPATLGIAATAMILCLLASGSWQAPGIAVPLLTLLAFREKNSTAASGALAPRLALIVLPLAGLTSFAFQSWMPTTKSWALVQQAGQATRLNEQLRIARLAVATDQLDSEPQRFVAQLLVADALSTSGGLFDKRSADAVDSLENWLAGDSAKAINWQFAGDRAFELAAQSERHRLDSKPLIEKTCIFYQEASRRHPTSVQLHVQLSVVLVLKGDLQAAESELALAAELSEMSPHADKKLAAQQIWLPVACEGLGNQPSESPWVPAEPVAEWIRTL